MKVGDFVWHQLGIPMLLVYQYGIGKDITYNARYKLDNGEVKEIKVKSFEVSKIDKEALLKYRLI